MYFEISVPIFAMQLGKFFLIGKIQWTISRYYFILVQIPEMGIFTFSYSYTIRDPYYVPCSSLVVNKLD